MRWKRPQKSGKILSDLDMRWLVQKLKSSAFQNAIARQMTNFCKKITPVSNPVIDLEACFLDFIGQNIAILYIVKHAPFIERDLFTYFSRSDFRLSTVVRK